MPGDELNPPNLVLNRDPGQANVPQADPLMARMAELLTQMADSENRRRSNPVRPKAIQCKTFKIGENYPNFASHFVECVRATYGFVIPADNAKLNAACLSWLPSKLEPGPTLTAYTNLDDDLKATWPILNDALKQVFADETERETFLADVASFKRDKRSLLEYKTELTRLMTTHLPNLGGMGGEFDRQITDRFIEGLEDDKLKKKLRRHCKRGRQTLEEAYNFALDYETSEVQTRIREGESAVLKPGAKGLSVIEKKKVSFPSGAALASTDTQMESAEYRKLHREMENMASKQKVTEMRVQELAAKSAHTDDRVDSMAKEVSQLSEGVFSRFDRLEKMLMNNSNQGQNQNQNRGYQQNNSGYQQGNSGYQQNNQGYSQNQQQYRSSGGRGQYRGGFRGPSAAIRPSLTGGPGYVNAPARPNSYRMQEPGSSIPVRPAPSHPSTGTGVAAAPSNTAAQPEKPADAAAATSATMEHPRTDPAAQCYEETASWWSPGMPAVAAMGYDDEYEGTYSYGNEGFYMQ